MLKLIWYGASVREAIESSESRGCPKGGTCEEPVCNTPPFICVRGDNDPKEPDERPGEERPAAEVAVPCEALCTAPCKAAVVFTVIPEGAPEPRVAVLFG